MPLPILPEQPAVDPAGDYARAQAWAMLLAKYEGSGNWAQWAAQMLQSDIADITNKLGSDTIGTELQALLDLISAVPALDFDSITPYVNPTAPTYTAIPSYSAPTLGTISAIPEVPDLTLPDAPTPTIAFTDTPFSDTLITSLRNRLSADLDGVTAAEAAMFARHTGRVTSENLRAYTQVTTQMSSGGWDVPPGSLVAKQTELNNEGGKRLTDASADIMMTAVKESLQSSLQLVDMLGRLNDNKVMRDFESAKASASLAIDVFKATIEGFLGEIQIAKTSIDAVVSANDGTIKVFMGQIEGQTAPMKAIADSNQAQASAYSAAVQGAGAAVSASATPEELKLKAMGVQGDIAGKAAMLQVEAAARQLQLEISTLQGLAQAASQMIASALGSVSSSTSFGFGGSATTGYDGDITEKTAANLAIAELQQSPGGY